jgi:hypothetical protein
MECSPYWRKGTISLWCMCWFRFNSLERRCTYALLPGFCNLVCPGSCLLQFGATSPYWLVSSSGFTYKRPGKCTHLYIISSDIETSELDHQTLRLDWFLPVIDFWGPGISICELYGGVFHEHGGPSSVAIYTPVVHRASSYTCPLVDKRMSRRNSRSEVSSMTLCTHSTLENLIPYKRGSACHTRSQAHIMEGLCL